MHRRGQNKRLVRCPGRDHAALRHQLQAHICLIGRLGTPARMKLHDKVFQGLSGILPQKLLIGICVDAGQVIGEEQAVRGNLRCSLGVIGDDPCKETVVFPETDAPAADTFAVDHARARDGELDGPRHGIFIKCVIIAGKEKPCLSVRETQAELKPGIRVGQNVTHHCIIALMYCQADPVQPPVLAHNAVVKIMDAVVQRDLLQFRTIMKCKSADTAERLRQGDGPQMCLFGKGVRGNGRDRNSFDRVRHLHMPSLLQKTGDDRLQCRICGISPGARSVHRRFLDLIYKIAVCHEWDLSF